MKHKITKAVLPVAGLGTRVMPLTLHQPKAMIGIVDRPMIHYVIDEILAAGIKHIIIVSNPRQTEFKKYFDYLKNDPEWRKLNVRFSFAVQKKPRGNGDAVLAASRFLRNEPFLICFSDDLLVNLMPDNQTPPLKTFLEIFEKTQSPILILEPVAKKIVSRYGVVAANKSSLYKNLYRINDVVEKPPAKKAPSNLTIIGRYVINSKILSIVKELSKITPSNKEIYLSDALKIYLKNGGSVFGWRFPGKRFDCGSKIGLIKAQAYFAFHHPQLKKEFRKYLKTLKQ